MKHPSKSTLRRVDGTLILVWLLVGVPLAYHFRYLPEVLVALMLYQIVVGHWNGWATNR